MLRILQLKYYFLQSRLSSSSKSKIEQEWKSAHRTKIKEEAKELQAQLLLKYEVESQWTLI